VLIVQLSREEGIPKKNFLELVPGVAKGPRFGGEQERIRVAARTDSPVTMICEPLLELQKTDVWLDIAV
jgi:hypothetical protein